MLGFDVLGLGCEGFRVGFDALGLEPLLTSSLQIGV